jgi:hypothetical protein
MKLYEVTCTIDQEPEGSYLVWSEDEQTAVDTAAEHVRSLVVAEANVVFSEDIDPIDYDGVLYPPCPGHESTAGPIGISSYCDGSCQV